MSEQKKAFGVDHGGLGSGAVRLTLGGLTVLHLDMCTPATAKNADKVAAALNAAVRVCSENQSSLLDTMAYRTLRACLAALGAFEGET